MADVLPLGDPRLRAVSTRVRDLSDPSFATDARRLVETLEAFRARHGFGRGIAAPQIGIALRLVALNLGQGPFVIVNPEITWHSEEAFTMWDDCMCFPYLLVRVRRHLSISVRYTDEQGQEREWFRLDQPTSELLQHEIDHLNGTLAIDLAIDRDSIIGRAAFEAAPDLFRAQVDYSIGG
ncbi:MAG: peptide deformylase [Armatimonadetes bacterium]|nr:peptide deformylase [Armatimonadota bacterium]